VLVDTGAWLAVFHARDQYHAPAAAQLRRLRLERVRLVVTDLILAELHLHLVRGLGPNRAVELLETVLGDPLVDEVFADHVLQSAAVTQWLRQFSDQPFTLTDAVSFATMRARGVAEAFTFDHHFTVAGFERVPPSAPG
jgi:predicted nucleic acid-binding protein